jgi:hypothetical protein
MISLLDEHAQLVLGSEIGQARFATGAYRVWRAHVRHLAREAGRRDADVLADLLLAPVAPDVYLEQRARGISSAAIRRALGALAHAVLAPAH